MALINFKSYAGRQEIGPFHKVRYVFYIQQTRTILICVFLVTLVHRKSEWSGKSNTIDALLFVFGYRVEDETGEAFGAHT